jgi:hypothetical protein
LSDGIEEFKSHFAYMRASRSAQYMKGGEANSFIEGEIHEHTQ